MRSRLVHWRTTLLLVLGVGLLIPSTVLAWFGRESAVLLVLGVAMILLALVSDWLPVDWINRIKSLQVTAGSTSMAISLNELQVLAGSVVAADAADLPPEVAARIDLAKAVIDSHVSRFLTTFDTRVVSGDKDPGAGMIRAGSTMQPQHRHGYVLLVGAAGRRQDRDATMWLVGELQGPEGYRDRIGADVDASGINGWFQTNTFLYNAPAGTYRITWSVGSSADDSLPFKIDTFDVPSVTHLGPDVEEIEWDRAVNLR